ncbi:MAG: hypothetical protein JXA09_09950 [Anaerolineae bacterium]|nr:hypothetical protein [Anaerolineae bacterium]
MSDPGGRARRADAAMGIRWGRVLLALLVAAPVTVICYLMGWWGLFTLAALLTLALLCWAAPRRLYPIAWTLYAVLALWLLTGFYLDGRMGAGDGPTDGWRVFWSVLIGFGAAVSVVGVFWTLVLFASTEWVLAMSDSLGVSRRNALRFVAGQVFAPWAKRIVVENGEIVVEHGEDDKAASAGLLARLGGPGVLVVHSGNAVVIERPNAKARIVGSGTYELQRFDRIKRPYNVKGIVDLRPQGASAELTDVMTSDGVPLKITVGMAFQIEPQSVTDARPESHFAGGDSETPVLGAPEYPVREAIVHRAVFATGPKGWQGKFPNGPVNVLRDIVGTYTLDEILPPSASRAGAAPTPAPAGAHDPDARVIRTIEEQVKARYSGSAANFGVVFRALDIVSVQAPDEVRALWRKVEEAEAERLALLKLSDARVQSLTDLEKARLIARANLVKLLVGPAAHWATTGTEPVAQKLIAMFQELIERVGEDEAVAMRYVQALEALVQTPGDKTVHITSVGAPGTPVPPTKPGP